MKKIKLEIAPSVNTEGRYQVLGRTRQIFDDNTNSNSSLDKHSFLESKSMDDWELMMLFFMIRNSGHHLLQDTELKDTLELARKARHKYAGHLKKVCNI